MNPPSRLPDIEARAARRCCVFVTGATAMTIATGALIGMGTGAALGAGTAALTGGDVLKGALIGGGTGALTGGVASGIGAAGGAAAGAGTGGAGGGAGGAAGGAGGTTGGMGFSGLSGGAGLTTAPGIGASGAAQMGQQAMTSGAGSTLSNAGGLGLAGVSGGSGLVPNATSVAGMGQEMAASEAAAQATKEAGMSSLEKGFSNFTSGLKSMPGDAMKWAGENPLQAIGLAGQGITALAQPSYSTPAAATQDNYTSVARPISPHYQASVAPSYRPTNKFYAEGGPVNKFYAAGLQQAQQAQAQQAPIPQAQPMQAQSPLPVAQQGIAGYARGRMVSGQGTGVSDGVDALIDGQQPAAIASGEYILPARFVSEIGQGSSSAGAKRLDQMVAKVQARRGKTVGKKGIAVDSKAYKALPA